MKKRFGFMLLMLILLTTVTSAQERSVVWERWDVVIENINTRANRFDVAEIYDLRFDGTFRFGSVTIPTTRLERLDSFRVYQNGQPFRESCNEQPATVCVREDAEEMSAIYYFNAPITNGKASFRIEYSVTGALRSYEGGDQLWWSAIPDEHYGFPIEQSQIIVNLPTDTVPREGLDPYMTYGAEAEVRLCMAEVNCPDVRWENLSGRVDAAAVVATASGLGGSDSLEIRIQYPHNPSMAAPDWQNAFDERRSYEENIKPWLDLLGLGLGLLIAVGGPLGATVLYFSHGRDPDVGPVPEYLAEPPSDLRPAIAGALVDETVHMRDILSTLIDAAHRGYMVIEESHREGIFGIGGGSEFTFKRTDKAFDDLLPYERKIMQSVFGGSMEVELNALKNKFYRSIPDHQNAIYDFMVKEGFFNRSPQSSRRLFGGIGGFVLVTGVVMTIMGVTQISENSWPLIVFCVPAALAINGLVLLALSRFMPAKTYQGALESARWRAFRSYLQNLEKYGDVDAAAGHFEAYLPYAVAFGLDKAWVRQFAGVETMGIPPWYYPTYAGGHYGRGYRAGTPLAGDVQGDFLPGELARAGGSLSPDSLSSGLSGGLESISDGLSQLLDSTASAMQSQPSSSGGGGFSGGGFSGGGSSGGGSRGFG